MVNELVDTSITSRLCSHVCGVYVSFAKSKQTKRWILGSSLREVTVGTITRTDLSCVSLGLP